MRVRDAESRVPAPRPLSAGAEKSVTSAPRGQGEEGPAPGTAGEGPAPPAAGRLPAPLPSPASRSRPRRRAGAACSGRRRRNAEGGAPRSPAGASLSPFPLPRGAGAQPASRRGLLTASASRVSPISPSPFALLSNFPAISRRARLPCLPFLQESECPALPGFHAARLRLPRPPKPASRPARLSPDPALAQRDRRRKGFRGLALSLSLAAAKPEVCFPHHPRVPDWETQRRKEATEGNGCPG